MAVLQTGLLGARSLTRLVERTSEVKFIDVDTGEIVDTLPPEIPLTEEDLTDPVLQPITEDPPELYDEDGWEAITDSGDFTSSPSLFTIVEWIRQLKKPPRRVTLIRHEEGDVK